MIVTTVTTYCWPYHIGFKSKKIKSAIYSGCLFNGRSLFMLGVELAGVVQLKSSKM
jgi:hypothetical protein